MTVMPHPKSGYRLKDGTKVPGVTSVLSRFKDSSNLMFWAFRQGQEGKERLYDSRDEAAEIGTYTHELIQWHIEGETVPEPSPDLNMTVSMIERSKTAYAQFLRWERQSGYFILSWEKPMVSEVYRIGGTPDAIFEFESRMLMGDWKSSKGIYSDAFLQCCAYIIIVEENLPHIHIDGIDIVRFSKDAAISDHRIIDDPKLIEIGKRQFLRLLDAYRDDQLINKHF